MTPSLFPGAVPDDQPSRERALDPGQSFIVQAPAGSGKTELLTQRFLRLLSLVDAPEEVVAITFTKKAASEMRGRVLEALDNAAAGRSVERHQRLAQALAEQVLVRDRERGWNLPQHPARLRIETIDALSNSLTRAMPWLARFGAMPEPVEVAMDLYRTAAARTVHVLGSDDAAAPAMRRLLEHLDGDLPRAERLLAELLAKRDQWLEWVAGVDRGNLRAVLEQGLAALIEDELAAAVALAPAFLQPRLPAAKSSELTRWNELIGMLLKKDDGWYQRVPSGSLPFVANLLPQLNRDAFEPLREQFAMIRVLPPDRYDDRQWATLEAVFPVLLHAAANLRIVFQTSGMVDFAEIARAALTALGPASQPTDLAFAMSHRIRHLLVDEFQDTAKAQVELLLRLTAGWENGDGRTLFVVGDPMQSIYRFRQAEVGLFLDARAGGVGALALEPLTLRVNFRSLSPVVEWANRAFERVFPDEDDSASGAVRFESATPFREGAEGGVEVHALFDRRQGEQTVAAEEARLVVELIERARADDPDQQIAVLVRARPHLSAIREEFRRKAASDAAAWRYRAVKVDALADSTVVRDLVALTRALVHLGDRPSWLAVLRAPWCGLTLADLHAVAGGEPYNTVWALLKSAGAESRLSADGGARVARVREALESVLGQRRRMPLRSWIESAWLRLGGPACAASQQERVDAEAFFELVEQFDEGGDLPDFDRLEERLSELYTEPDPMADARLQVMPIHQAKGLEFDTVILAGLGMKGKSDDKPLMAWLEDRGRLLVAPIAAVDADADPIYKFLEHVESKKQKAELRRLLYVGATRARRRLHLIGHTTIKKDGTLAKPQGGSLLHCLWPVVESEFEGSWRESSAKLSVVSAAMEPSIARLPPGWEPPVSPAGVRRRGAGAMPTESTDRVTFEWVGDTLRHAGVVAHRYLQQVARDGLDRWSDAGVDELREPIRRAVAGEGVPPAECAVAAEIVEGALRAALSDPKGRWTLGTHAEAETEAGWSGVLDGHVIRARVDRTFVDEEGVRWIVDFKTSSHEGSDVEAFLDNERERYRAQMERYGRLLSLRDGGRRRVKVGLYFPLLRGWREWEV